LADSALGAKMTSVGVVGGTGYSGQEMARLLKRHPRFSMKFEKGRDFKLDDHKGQVEAIFLCTPNETSLELAPQILAAGIHVIDLSGAYRLKKHDYKTWYGFEHTEKKSLDISEYGLYPWKVIGAAEKNKPRLIANPGCFTTTILMGLIPLLKNKLIRADSVYIDAKSGTTGAGRKPEINLLHAEVADDILPYKIGRHQHWPELVESAHTFAGEKCEPVFVTELLPIRRGISAAIFSDWGPGAKMKSAAELRACFESYYASHPDIIIKNEGQTVDLKSVAHTNEVHISLHEAYGRPLVFVATDNLLRGAAGQALMNANLLFGFDVREGL
jgi:N-acetyl-gamma-glutamyl-phosphate reductase